MTCHNKPGQGSLLLLPAFILGVLLLLPGCSHSDQPGVAVKTYDAAPEKVAGLARVEPEERIVRLCPQVAGTISAVLVQLGEKVRKEQLLFEMEHEMEEGKLQVIEAQVEAQAASIKASEAALKKLAALATHAKSRAEKMQKVYEQGAGTKQEAEEARIAWESAALDLEAAKAALESARAKLSELQANFRLARLSMEKYFIQAPTDGIMLSVEVASGTSVTPSSPLGDLVPDSPMCLMVEIDELFAHTVLPGQPAYVRLQGGRDTIARGRVILVAPALRQKSLFAEEVGKLEDRRVRQVKVRLEDGQGKLLFGQRVECIIDVKKAEKDL